MSTTVATLVLALRQPQTEARTVKALHALDRCLDHAALREALYETTERRAVQQVRKLRKSLNKTVATLALQLLRKWRLRVKRSLAWKKWRNVGYAAVKGHRHPAGTKTKTVKYTHNGRNFYRYLTATGSCYGGRIMPYIYSRLNVYCPLYRALVRATGAYQGLATELAGGKTLLLLDYDAPEQPTEMMLAQLSAWSTQHAPHGKPFGHGYVLAWALLEEAHAGRIFLARLPDRGSGTLWPTLPGAMRVNVTSGSTNKIAGHKATQLSPMYLGPVNAETCGAAFPGGPPAQLLENYWQYGKIFPLAGHAHATC